MYVVLASSWQCHMQLNILKSLEDPKSKTARVGRWDYTGNRILDLHVITTDLEIIKGHV